VGGRGRPDSDHQRFQIISDTVGKLLPKHPIRCLNSRAGVGCLCALDFSKSIMNGLYVQSKLPDWGSPATNRLLCCVDYLPRPQAQTKTP
jgi:hypothetical protein